MLRRHLNFRQISHRFTSSFANPSFQDLNGSHTIYWNMIILNPSRFKVEPHSKYWYFSIERWDLFSLRFSENAVLFHIEWLCRKTAGNVNRPPYRYTGVTHMSCIVCGHVCKVKQLKVKGHLKINLSRTTYNYQMWSQKKKRLTSSKGSDYITAFIITSKPLLFDWYYMSCDNGSIFHFVKYPIRRLTYCRFHTLITSQSSSLT